MKKIILTLALVAAAATSAFAQASIGAGFLSAKDHLKGSLAGKSINGTETMRGFYVGIDYKIEIIDDFGIAPGVYFEYLNNPNSNYDLGPFTSLQGKWTHTEMDVAIPINLNYSFNLGAMVLSLYAGPNFQIGCSNKEKGTAGSVSYNYDIYKELNYNRFDVLLGGGATADFLECLRLNIGYYHGVINRLKDVKEASINRGQFHVGLAYVF